VHRTASNRVTSSCHCAFDTHWPIGRDSSRFDERGEEKTVRLTQLRIENLRNIEALELELSPGFNLFCGPNGAGKTSILESAYLLSHARSFRTAQTNTLIRHNADKFNIFARIERVAGPIQVGLTRHESGWSAKVNNDNITTLSSMLKEYAQVCFEPGTHALISGGSEERRGFLDWGVFHVEQGFMTLVRQFRRALQQRNAALKQGGSDAELDGWDAELAGAGQALTDMRSKYFRDYSQALAEVLSNYLPELGAASAQYAQGWPDGVLLQDSLRQVRSLDRARGYSSRGPHRADWSIRFVGAPLREHLSRGQEKLCALACVLAQAKLYASARGEWPVIALDDLSSELDPAHQRVVVAALSTSGAQVLISAIDVPASLRETNAASHMFHVEHGRARTLL
jgi:DNA replication and repair protein RecF